MRRVLTTCIYCGCGCGLYLLSDGKRLTGSYPSRNHPVSKGALCVKGWNCYEFSNDLNRLTTPLIKKNGKFLSVTWGEALALIGEKFKRYQTKCGPDSLAFLSSAKATNEENYLMMKLARGVFRTNNVDHCARLCHASTVAGLAATFGSGAMTNSINEFEDAEVILVTGSDTTSQHPLIGSRIIQAVNDRKAKLILVDPRAIELTKYAVIHAQPKIGTDVAWINGLINVIIAEGLYDKKFIAERTEGFEELKKFVKEYPPEYVSKITSIPRDNLVEIARLYAKAHRAMIVYSMGITQHTTGVDNVESLANLAMVTGHIGFASTGVNPLRGQNNVQGACDMGALPNVYSGYQSVTDEKIRKKFQQEWRCEDLPSRTGLTVTEIISAAGEGSIKGLYIMGENPALSDPDSHHVRKCLSEVEFLVVQDIFLSDTAEYADVVLPAASFAEKDGTFTSTERRVQRIRKIISPPGQAKADWQILCEIAKRMDYDGMDYQHPSQIMDEIGKLTPIYGGISYQRLETYGLQWPCPTRDHPGTQILHTERFTKGKGTFMPRPYLPPAEVTDEEYNFGLSTGRVYWHWHTRTMTNRTSTLERESPEPYVEMNLQDAKELQINDGQLIKVTSRRGTITLKAKLGYKVPKGMLFIPFHYREAAANVLTISAVDPIAKIPEYKVCAVRVEKI
ncbi:MAG: formate dehydrogenase subunit alpha [bacterium (Candidatus Ratteibacteria) CG23_combo_of_CG06-09_8_20_14_all_48_7]|uniref:Formate dehydrogenase subunit alpha n=1 Tax=bacterium (Candidatus Ratteibacteria) CG23_combo_of_CG06-09_8_20_14_all_48_7 TaxID=2014292 RepID=A0A2G9YAH9_9BACT|nr:MAG: formate dehydrogenase subunit alpha [bacterium (Candidatus Ratteibacteria) CG23_combo_of_CG06-09_8_20_14_all_48_7]